MKKSNWFKNLNLADEKYIAERIVEEHNKEIEKVLKEI